MIHKLNSTELQPKEDRKENRIRIKEIQIPSDYWNENYTLFTNEEAKREEIKQLSPQRYESQKPSNFNWNIKDGDYIIRDPELNGLTQTQPKQPPIFIYFLLTIAAAMFITYTILDFFTKF